LNFEPYQASDSVTVERKSEKENRIKTESKQIKSEGVRRTLDNSPAFSTPGKLELYDPAPLGRLKIDLEPAVPHTWFPGCGPLS
jgi:hypothetical protein